MNHLTFKKLDIDDKQVLEEYLKDFLPFSDFTFLSLFSYNTKGDVEYCFYKGNLIVKFEDYVTGENFYSLIGNEKIDDAVDVLLEHARIKGHRNSINLVPHSVIKQNPHLSERFEIVEDRDNFDYVVSTLDVATLGHEKFPKKRKLVDEFREKHPDLVVKTIDLTNKHTQDEITKLFEVWLDSNGKNYADAKIEFEAIKRLLKNSHHFPNLYALGVYDGRKLVAFNTFEISTHSHGISSFQKADRKYHGIYAFLTHEMAKNMSELGCKYINFEQDLGIEGLRSSKQSWHPINYLKKYTIKPRV